MNNMVIEQLNPLSGKYGNGVLLYCTCQVYSSGKFSETNPSYASTDFLIYCPEFTNILADPTYLALFNSLEDMANHCLDYKLFGAQWKMVMSYYIAHYLIKSLERIASVNSIDTANTGQMISNLATQPLGIVIKEDLGGENLSYDNLLEIGTFKDAGDFLTTVYGRTFWDMYIPYGRLRKIGRYC